MRANCPGDEINFVYDSELLSEAAQADLLAFCEKHQLTPVDANSFGENPNLTEKERHLFNLHKEEIRNLNQGGNLAVSSDLVRWMSPVYNLGTYSDFDVEINTRGLVATVAVQNPILLNVGSVQVNQYEIPNSNNDIIAIVDATDSVAQERIQAVQTSLVENCSHELAITLRNAEYADKEKFKQDLTAILMENWLFSWLGQDVAEQVSEEQVLFLKAMTPGVNILEGLRQLSAENTPRQFRAWLQQQLASNAAFCRSPFALPSLSGQIEIRFGGTPSVQASANRWRELTKLQLTWWNRLILPKKTYNAHKKLVQETDDEKVLSMVRANLKTTYLLQSVVQTSGPATLARLLCEHALYKRDTFDEALLPYSFDHYGLGPNFLSENGVKPHTTGQEYQNQMGGAEVGDKNDLSWIEEGQDAMRVREERMTGATLQIKHFIKKRKPELSTQSTNLKADLEAHRDKIQRDLEGCFGWYRHDQRLAKIAALDAILGYFDSDTDTLSASAFLGADKSVLESEGVSASIGQSKTQALIARVSLFAEKAAHFEPVDGGAEFGLPGLFGDSDN